MPGRKRTEILSCVAQQYSNKELKEHFKNSNSKGEEISCTDYKITRAKMHAKTYGPGAECPKINRTSRHKLEPSETIAFVLDFVHHPDCIL